MRSIQIAVASSVCLIAGSALAAPLAPVSSPQAGWSAAHRHELVVRAEVTLVTTCRSNPQLVRAPAAPSPPPGSTVAFTAQADNTGGRGVACGMIVRKAAVCTETTALPMARQVAITGSNGVVSTGISRTAPDCPVRSRR